MDDCPFCHVPAILATTTVAFLASPIQITKQIYKSYVSIETPEISQSDFTPGFRAKLMAYNKSDQVQAQAKTHKEAWLSFLKTNTPHAIIFESEYDANDNNLAMFLENLSLPKDWDIVSFSPTQYILTKRAARILYKSSIQFNCPIQKYIHSFKVLKVIEQRIKSSNI